MQAYRVEMVIPENGIVQLKTLPFEKGSKVEIIVLGLESSFISAQPHHLKGTVLKYEAPFDAVSEAEWDVLK